MLWKGRKKGRYLQFYLYSMDAGKLTVKLPGTKFWPYMMPENTKIYLFYFYYTHKKKNQEIQAHNDLGIIISRHSTSHPVWTTYKQEHLFSHKLIPLKLQPHVITLPPWDIFVLPFSSHPATVPNFWVNHIDSGTV